MSVALTIPQEMQLVANARRLLVEAKSIDEVKQIRDKAAAVKLYMQQAGESLEAQNAAAEIKVRAERRAGEMLAEMEKNKGAAAPRQRASAEEARTDPPRVKDIGITHKQSSRFQQVAAVPEPAFEKHIEETKAASKPITTSGVAKLAPSRLSSAAKRRELAKRKPGAKRKPSECASIIETLDGIGNQITTIRQQVEATGGQFETHKFDLPEQVKRLNLARNLISQVRASIKGA